MHENTSPAKPLLVNSELSPGTLPTECLLVGSVELESNELRCEIRMQAQLPALGTCNLFLI